MKPDAQKSQIERLCNEAREYKFTSVCVNPVWVETCQNLLEGSPISICSVIGFPLGASLSQTKVEEAQQVLDLGTNGRLSNLNNLKHLKLEINMVAAIGKIKEKDYDYLVNDIKQVVKVAQGLLLN